MITKCRSCHSKELEDVLDLGDQYLSDFREDDTKPEVHPLVLIMCKNCLLVQLRHTTPPSQLYHDRYGYYSGISDTMRIHLKGIVDAALRLAPELRMEDVVVDIGSNDATLLKYYPKELIRIGFDPVSKFSKYYDELNLLHANYYFSKEIYQAILAETPHKGKKAKIVTAISMFYDLEDPNKFVSDIDSVLADDGICIVQQNYVDGMIKLRAFDNIVHEHLEYYSLASMEHLLHRHGLEVFDVEENDLNGGSFRTYIRRMNRVDRMRALERTDFEGYEEDVKKVKRELYTFVKQQVAKGKKVYVYGASTRGNTLLQYCNLDNKLITAAVERNPDKFGKKISSLGIPIISEKQARKENPDFFLVLPWFFKEEFIKREYEYVKKGGSLIFPLPEFHVINAKNIDNHTER